MKHRMEAPVNAGDSGLSGLRGRVILGGPDGVLEACKKGTARAGHLLSLQRSKMSLMSAHRISVADRPHQQSHLKRESKRDTKRSHASHSENALSSLVEAQLQSATTGIGQFMQSSLTSQQ